MGMNMDLAAMYGTPGGPTEEDLEKTAQADLFVKLAGENGIDLTQYNDEQIAQLWDQTFGAKEAQGKCEKCGKEECSCPAAAKEGDKEAAAQAEFEAGRELQEKVAEMDYLGRLMAHAYVQELGEIGDQMDKESGAARTAAGAIGRFGKGVGEDVGALGKYLKGKGEAAGKAVSGRTGTQLERLGAKVPGRKPGSAYTPPAGSLAATERAARHRTVGKRIVGGTAAGVGVAGGGAYAAGRKKQSSAIDEFAAQAAVEKAAAANWDPEEAAELIGAILTLGGPEENEKTAAAQSVEEVVDLRSLDFLEAAGYPVDRE